MRYNKRKCTKCGTEERNGSSLDCWMASEIVGLDSKEKRIIGKQEPLCDDCIKKILGRKNE